jgi:cation diffusion facilitator CzcD-associated flavoprotein CzcO
VIIGAGFGGTAAAVELLEQGLDNRGTSRMDDGDYTPITGRNETAR